MRDINGWFAGTRASFLVIPRVLLEDMPTKWQEEMVKLLEEYDNTFDQTKVGVYSCSVQAINESGKFIKMPDSIKNYRHPDKVFLSTLKGG